MKNPLRSSLVLLAAAALVIWTLGAPTAQAQVLYGSVVGEVTDASGAVIPNAAVTVKNTETGLSRDATTDGGGRYSFVNVLPGKYTLKVVATGFRTFAESAFDVSPNTVARVDSKLEVGQITDQVTVQGEAVALQTDKADTHSEINTKEISSLPIGGYRNYQSLINLVPGAMPAAFQNSITDTPGRALATNINGGNGQTNITRIDGAASVNVWLPHHVGYVTPEENIETVNVTTSAADAEQGLAGSSAITLVTKSGTNDIHGSAFEFHDDQHLKARNFFQAAGTDKPLSIYNNYGGTVGGPIKKNKLFYFLSFDGTGQRQGLPVFYTVPTDAQKAGNFSGISTVVYNPMSATNGVGRTPFPGNIIPLSMISPIAQKLESYYPEPNFAGPNLNANNYFASGGPILNRKYFDAKGNYVIDEKSTMFAKYGRMWATSGGKGVFGIAGGPGLGGSDPGLGHTTIQVATLGYNRIISPHIIFDAVLGYERQDQNVLPNDYGTNYGQQFGIPNTNGPDPRQSGFPDITISNYTGFGVPNWMPVTRVEESYTHSDNITWTKGAHEFRFGFDMVRHHLNHWQPEIGNFGPRGGLGFNGQETALSGGPSPNQFNAYAAFLTGLSDDAEKSLEYILATGREWQFGWYARDRWQVGRKLTINLGLRYELYPLMTRAGYGIEQYNPSNNNVYLGGRGNVPENAGISVSHTLFAPRIGLAYRLGENTVIRAGYGINYDPIPFSRPLRGWYPIVVNFANTASGFGWATSLSQGVPNTVGPDLSTGVVPLPPTASERSPQSYIHRGYEQSWNFTLEHKLPMNLITSVGYVGSHSVHLLADQDINSGYPGSGTTGLPYYAAYGRTVPTLMWDGYLSSSYNSLQVAVDRSFSNGLLVKAAYTYSHSIDYADADGWQAVQWNWAPIFQRNRATAGFDRTQNLQIGWLYELPFGKGKMLAKSGVAAAVLGNWQVNGIMSAYTGLPFQVTSPGASLNAPDNTQTANLVKPSVTRIGNAGPGQFYYDPTAFAAVTANTFGNSGRNILRNPGVWNTDLDITREFPVMERLRLQFRAEFFNLPNTSHFGGVSTSVTSGTFMQITSASGERQMRFGLRATW